MRTLDITKIIAIIAFLCLAGFSCFWTAESLYVWQPSITIYGAWMIAVVFFIIASICFGNLLKALDRQSDFYGKLFGRTGALLLAFIGLMAFWLFMSLPTNTHTLLYRASIRNVIMTDLTRTQGYLQGLKDNNVEIKKIEQKYADKANNVQTLRVRMEQEINNPSAVGIGTRFEDILKELERVLSADAGHSVKIQRVAKVGTTRSQWYAAFDYYMSSANEQLALYKAECDKKIAEIKNVMNSQALDNLIKNNKVALKDISNMDGIDNNIIDKAVKDLGDEYSYIQANSQYINFKDRDKELYTRDGAIPEAQMLRDVPGVWKDFLTTDRFAGHGFIGWVFIALLVDIAGFIFFNIAFNKKNNNAIA